MSFDTSCANGSRQQRNKINMGCKAVSLTTKSLQGKLAPILSSWCDTMIYHRSSSKNGLKNDDKNGSYHRSKKQWVSAAIPSKIEWDLTNGPLRKLLELLDTQVQGSVQWVLLEISWSHGPTAQCVLGCRASCWKRCPAKDSKEPLQQKSQLVSQLFEGFFLRLLRVWVGLLSDRQWVYFKGSGDIPAR